MMWLTMVAGNLEMVWQVKLRMGMKVMGEVVFSVLILMCLFFFKNGLSLMMVLQIYLGARILSLVVAVGWIKRLTEVNKIEKWQKEGIKRLWKEVWPMGVYLLIFVAYDRVVDSLMIERFLGIREVAWYGLAYKMYAVLIMPAYFLMGSAFPLLAKGGENKEGEKKVRWLLMAGAVVIMAVVELVAPSMVEVMGGDGYQPTVWVLRGLMIALFFAYNNHWLGFKLIASGKQKLVLRAGLVALVVNFVGNLWVIPRFGIMGAVAVTGLTELVSSVVLSLRSGS
jgi:PST family polysaccharide transporter